MSKKITGNKRYRVISSTDGHCWYCGFQFPNQAIEIKDMACIDHIVPISMGGSDEEPNLRPACWKCNATKNNKTVEDFRYYLWLRDNKNVQAAQKLLDAVNLANTPFNNEIRQAIEWLISESPAIVFWGESNE